jgi:ElaB/YqjD/DUF883 family membrane-anchored ribosome-binding protein
MMERGSVSPPRVLYSAMMSCALEERMDQQRIQERASEAADKVGTVATDAVQQAGASMKGKLDQGKAMIQDAQAGAASLARQASEAGRQAMAQAGEVARQASDQATQAATNLYQQGSRASDFISRYTAEQPVTALLVAGAIGYGLAYLIHRR